MAQPLTFGVEFEFAIAYLLDDSPSLPHPSDTNKVLHFEPNEEDWDMDIDLAHTDDPPLLFDLAMKCAIRRHIRTTIKEAGFPVSGEKNSVLEADISNWEVVDDLSVEGPKNSPYSWFDMEVRSPALYFTAGSLKTVADVCTLLTNTYGINVGVTTGLHIHCGDSDHGFNLPTLCNLVAFLWAFEPQLNSLHPQERQDIEWAASMRQQSRYALQYEDKYGRRPHPLTGAVHFLSCKSIEELVMQASKSDDHGIYKFNQYNFQGFFDRDTGLRDSKATIEFRQHEGSINPEAVINWIKTAVGIVDYVKNIDNASLTDLLRIVEHETWEKIGDGKDDEREAKLGPILAESRFSIIDLLSHMKLWGPATYYRSRWRKLKKKRRSLLPTPIVDWEHEKEETPGSDEYKIFHWLREIWEEDRVLSRAQTPGRWEFDPNDSAWPEHKYLVDEWDGATDVDAEKPRVAEVNGPPPPPPPHAEPNALYQPREPTKEELAAEEALLDQQLKEFEEQEAAETMDAEDTEWRRQIRDRFGGGVLPRGSMNPFDDSLPRIRRWRGRRREETPEVSPTTVMKEEDDESDGEMPFL